ncbi:MAG: hypothetical protein EXR71_07720 [Myxococcales bacterium]|nr:hypothetical protein [Myxococcales bacterium]
MPDDKPAPAAGAMRAVESAAHAALDGVERILFGAVGGAEDAVRELEAESALDRARRHYGVAPAEPTATAHAEDPVARAQKQLDELKRLRAEPADDAPTPVRVRTL